METKLSRQEIYSGKVIHVVKDEVEVDNKRIASRELVMHNGGACIGLQDGEYFYLVRQYRYAFNDELLEFPAGKIEKGEEPYQAICREVLEETGYKAKQIEKLGVIYPTCGYSNEKIYMYYGQVDKYVGQNLDPDEDIVLEKYTLKQIDELIKKGEIVDGKSIAMAYYLRGRCE